MRAMNRRIRNLVKGQTTVRFSRGSAFGSLFSPSERHHKQDVVVTVTERDDTATVVCRHVCWDAYPNLHTEPWLLHREVQQIADFVRERTHEIGTSVGAWDCHLIVEREEGRDSAARLATLRRGPEPDQWVLSGNHIILARMNR